MPYCGRYHSLHHNWEMLDAQLKAGNREPQVLADHRFALAYLQAHAEACEECIEALRSAFPETTGKAFHMVSLLDED